MAIYLLDTNTISLLLRGNPGVARRLQKRPMSEV
ncbi:MAG: type II toxin-antitoxin system VapC family toxin, partial [Betaproteobacteria bacterium]|nr:type II toxin-antitoxin system VapC family toxin [Betaproteobacteria bacterium]